MKRSATFDGSLYDYLKTSSDVEALSLADADEASALLSAIHDWFEWFLEDVEDLHPATALLTFNAVIMFNAAVKLALSGQAHAVYAVLRGALEAACYAQAMADDPVAIEAWSSRERSPADKAVCRRVMSTAVRSTAAKLNARQAGTGSCVSELYEAAIDWGAHPNVRSVMGNTIIGDDSSDLQARLIAIHGPNGLATVRAKNACIDLGVTLAIIISYYKQRRKPGYQEAINDLIQARESLFSSLLEAYPPESRPRVRSHLIASSNAFRHRLATGRDGIG